jgi:cytochrome c oxidase assembly factor CtaG
MMHHTAGFSGVSSPLALALASTLLIAAAVYARGWFRLHRLMPQIIAPWRLIAFLCGLGALWVAIGSPLAAFDEQLLTVHMVQHLLLSVVAAPLLLLGAPALPLLHGMPRLAMRRLGVVFRWSPVRALGRILGQPAVCWSVAMVVFVAWHIPPVFDLGLRSGRWHVVEHASFFASGLIFWWPVIQPWPSTPRWPRWSMPLYLFCATLPCDVLSAFLAFSDRVVYPAYLSAPRPFGWSVLQDQACAGALMWLCVTLAYVIPAAILTTTLLSPGQESVAP